MFNLLMPILGHREQFSASVIGVLLAAFSAGSFCIRMLMFLVSRRYTEWQIMLWSSAMITVVYLILPFTHIVPLLIAVCFVFGLAFGCGQPNILSLLHAESPSGRGAEAVGLRQILCNVTGVFVPLLFGVTVTSFGLTPTFFGLAGMMATAIPIARKAGEA
jgi:predicted MFS family arabinose efflux permease